MFSKVISRVSQYQQLTSLQTRAFRASAIANANQKPSIGDAVTILQSKVSGINQVVSQQLELMACRHGLLNIWYMVHIYLAVPLIVHKTLTFFSKLIPLSLCLSLYIE